MPKERSLHRCMITVTATKDIPRKPKKLAAIKKAKRSSMVALMSGGTTKLHMAVWQ